MEPVKRGPGRPKGSTDKIKRKRTQDPKQIEEFLAKGREALEARRGKVMPPKPWVMTAARMVAKGMRKTDIAVALNKTVVTINNALKAHPSLIEQASRELANPEDMFLPMMPKAAAAYHEVLDTVPEDAATMRVKSSVAQDLFDRAYGRPVQRNISEGRQSITITFVDGDDESSQKNQEHVLRQIESKVIDGPIV